MLARRAAVAVLAVWISAVPGRAVQSPAGSTIDPRSLDPEVRPQDDLYLHVNGRWLAAFTMPAEHTGYGVFLELAARAEQDIRAIVEDLVARGDAERGSPERQVADLYASLMDEARIEALGTKPIEPVLRRIAAVASPRDVAREAGRLASIAGGGPFETTVGADPNDASKIVVQLAQSGAMLPDRDRYLVDTPAHLEIRAKYVEYLTTIFRLTGREDPAADARAVLALETELARAQVPAGERASTAGARSYTLDGLRREMPGFDWHAWARPQGLERASAIVLLQPGFFRGFAELASALPLSTWRAWLAARYITVAAPFISSPFAAARFEFFGRTLSGQVEPRARWRRAVSLVNAYLGDTVGRLYVARHFPAAARARSERLSAEIVRAFRQALGEAGWMTREAREEAQAKLARLVRKVGAPTEWREYDGLEMRADDLLGNIQRALQFQARLQMQALAEPRRSGAWLMPPQTVNAYYNPELNEVVVPAALLQPPLFDPAADEAVNYGAIGALMAHEIAHGFDERGRFYDSNGALRDWWSAADAQEFAARAARLVRQYDDWCVENGLRPTGQLTLRENLGDLVGLSVAFRAYRNSLEDRPSPVVDGLRGEQRFFLAWAHVWRWKIRSEYLDQWGLSSPHAHPRFRANGPASNLAGFYDAFGMAERDRLFRRPQDRVAIW